MNNIAVEPNLLLQSIILYGVPFLGFYFGIWLRHYLGPRLFRKDVLSLGEACAVGVLFSLISVAPLLAAFGVATSAGNVQTYLLTLTFVIQAGLFMPEALGRAIADAK